MRKGVTMYRREAEAMAQANADGPGSKREASKERIIEGPHHGQVDAHS